MTNNPQSLHQSVTSEDKKSITSFYTLVGFIITVVVAAAFAVLSVYISKFNGKLGNQELFGQFGDYLGGVLNPIIGFATIVLLVVSLTLQMKELTLTRKEMIAANHEASEARKAMQDQVAHLDKEAKLNETIRLINDVKNKIEHKLSLRIVPHTFKTEHGALLNFDDDSKNFAYILSEQFRRDFYDIYWSVRRSQLGLWSDDEYIDNPNESNWRQLEVLTICYSQLVLKYQRISPSDEFDTVYRIDAYEYLSQLCEILRTDALFQAIKALGYEFEPTPNPYKKNC